MDDLLALASRRLSTRWAGHPIEFKTTTDSTNDDVRAAAFAGAPTGYTVVADSQRRGRGRRGRAWHSPPGDHLYLSLLARPSLSMDQAPVLALASALAVTDAIEPLAPTRHVTIKWPNDVRIDGLKIAGILVEGSVRTINLAFAVIGIGINVLGTSFPESIASRATTLQLATGEYVSRAHVLESVLAALEARIDAMVSSGIESVVSQVAARCDTLGTHVRIDQVEGIAERLAPSGGLLVRQDNGRLVEVCAGEVTAPYR